MLRAAASSSSRRQASLSATSTTTSSLQRLPAVSSPSSSSSRFVVSPPPPRSRISTRYLHATPRTRLAVPLDARHEQQRHQDQPPPPSSHSPNRTRRNAQPAPAPSRKADAVASAAAAKPKPTATMSPSTSRSTDAAHSSTSKSSPSPPSPSSSSSPPPPSPPPPPSDKSIPARIKALYHQVKFLFRFYLNGVKQIWTDRQRVQELKQSVQTTGRRLVWSEQRLMRVHADDLKKLPLFLAILIILEEILPLVVIYAPSLLPSTCILPSQLLKIRQTEEVKRAAAIERLRGTKEVQDLMALAGWSVQQKPGDKQDTIQVIEKMFPLHGEKGQDISAKLKTLSKDTLIDFSRIFALGTALRPASWMRSQLEAHMAFLTKDDDALRGGGSGDASSTAKSPDYSQVPESGPVLAEISSQRGMRCCELESSDMFENLRDWLRVTSVFHVAAKANSKSATAATATATTATTPLASPLQMLFLPLLLYPAPLFTPSLKQLQAREESEAQKGILERSKEVAQEVIRAEEVKAQREADVEKQSQDKDKKRS